MGQRASKTATHEPPPYEAYPRIIISPAIIDVDTIYTLNPDVASSNPPSVDRSRAIRAWLNSQKDASQFMRVPRNLR